MLRYPIKFMIDLIWENCKKKEGMRGETMMHSKNKRRKIEFKAILKNFIILRILEYSIEENAFLTFGKFIQFM